MTQSHTGTPNVFMLALMLQLAALVLALLGIHFGAVQVQLLGGNTLGEISLGVMGALLSWTAALWLTRSNTAVGSTLRRHSSALHWLFRRMSWGQLTLLALAAGVCEEVLFRGFLQTWLARHTGLPLGVLIASVAFALLHCASWVYFAVTLVIGVLLGVVYAASGSLLSVMVWHGVYDLVALAVLARYPHLLGVAGDPGPGE